LDIIAFKTLDVIDPIISSSRSDSGNNFDTAHGRFQKIEKNPVEQQGASTIHEIVIG